MHLEEQLGPSARRPKPPRADLAERGAVERLLGRDHTLWQDDPTEVADRLGWLDCPTTMVGQRGPAPASSPTRAEPTGSSGSSCSAWAARRCSPRCSPAPSAAGPTASSCRCSTPPTPPPSPGSAPSGRSRPRCSSRRRSRASTIETRSHLEHFWATQPRCRGASPPPPIPDRRWRCLAAERSFRATFENPADIGGRYSALSLFGLVPAALAGVSADDLLDGAAGRARRPRPGGAPRRRSSPPASMRGATSSRSSSTPASPPSGSGSSSSSPSRPASTAPASSRWSASRSAGPRSTATTGSSSCSASRRRRPTASTPWSPPATRSSRIPFDDGANLAFALGAQVQLWEAATALCGAALGINPFDQPDVAAAKAATQAGARRRRGARGAHPAGRPRCSPRSGPATT